MQTTEILRAAREKIASREKWTQHAYAKDENGEHVITRSPRACRWCAMGAVYSVLPSDPSDPSGRPSPEELEVNELLLEAVSELGDYFSVESFNDSSTHEDVLKAFDRAIEKAAQQPEVSP